MRFGTLTKLLFCLLLPHAAHAAAGDDFVVYEAQTRSSDELKKAADGVNDGARVTTMGAKVIVYGSKAQRDAVLRVLAKLDHPLANYVVQLRLASHSRASKDSAGVNAKGGPKGVSAEVSLTAFDGEAATKSVRELTVGDGGTAKLYSDAGIYPRTVTVHLRSIGRSGAHVEIREADSNAVGEQAIVTELDLPLKEWRSIGAISGSDVVQTGEIPARTKRSSMSREDVQMRVSLAPAG